MKKPLFPLLFIFSIWLTAYSQDIEYARFIVSKLASPDFKGRGYVGKGDKISSHFIKNEFIRLGLQPLNNSYFQDFNISVNTFPGSTFLEINNKVLEPGVQFIVEACSPSVKGTFNTVPISRYEISDKVILLKKLREAAGAFLLIDNRQKTGENTDNTKGIDKTAESLKYDPEIRIKGVIVLTKERLVWEASTTVNCRPVIILNADFDSSEVKYVKIDIKNKLIKDYATRNVTAIIRGSVIPDSFIVVTAHYDHLGMFGKDVYFPGANDNASGIAMLLNLAKYYSLNKPRYSMVFIAFSAEELGLIGANEFVNHPLIKLDRIKFLINFDLAGTGEEGIRVVNGSVYKDKFNLLAKINEENMLLPKIDLRGEACISDHCPFFLHGVPCFYIYTQGGISAYHDIYDKSETLPFTEFNDYFILIVKFFNLIL